MSLPDYVVVSPVRDEAAHLPRTAASMAAQTHRATEWVIVDDGSTDGTRELAEGLAGAHPWIRVVSAPPREGRARGGRVVEAFNAGYEALSQSADIVVKMDGDLYLPPHYFEWVARTFEREPHAGIVGGTILEHDGSVWRPAHFNPRHVRGAFKAYRRECLEQIGGLRPAMGWDGIDEYGARARGWKVIVLTELPVLHYKPRGSKQPWQRARVEEGRACHYMGYRLDFLLVRTPYRAVVDHPPLLGALAVLVGWTWSAIRGRPRIDDPEALRAVREEQRSRVLGLIRRRRDLPPTSVAAGGPAFWGGTEAEGSPD